MDPQLASNVTSQACQPPIPPSLCRLAAHVACWPSDIERLIKKRAARLKCHRAKQGAVDSSLTFLYLAVFTLAGRPGGSGDGGVGVVGGLGMLAMRNTPAVRDVGKTPAGGGGGSGCLLDY